MPRTHQEIGTTASRHAQPRAWLRAVRWLVAAGLHPRASSTTLQVAADLARRMDYTEGTVLYDMLGTARRTRLSVPTVKRHVRVLRELGALVWVRHGSRRNLRLPGRRYAGTATIYAATIPPAYDRAMGHRIAGTGYDARVAGVTPEGRARAVAEARTAARRPANPRRAHAGSGDHDPHSLGGYGRYGKAEVSGRLKDTTRGRATCPTASTHHTASPTSTRQPARRQRRRGRPTGRHPLQVARDIAIARQVRPLVRWVQHEQLRRLAFALRPLIDRGLDAHDIAAELHAWWMDWRPARPAAYITAELRRRAERQAEARSAVPPNADFRAAVAGRPSDLEDQAPAPEPAGVEALSRDEVIAHRSAAAADPELILAAIDYLGERDARRLYTSAAVDAALRRAYGVSGWTVVHG